MEEKKLISVKNIVDGFKSLIKVKDALGENSTFWLGLIEGINKKMNMDFLDAFENHKEGGAFLHEKHAHLRLLSHLQ